jgi:hypothetical protein
LEREFYSLLKVREIENWGKEKQFLLLQRDNLNKQASLIEISNFLL